MPNNIDYYISKGYDIKAAEYFASGRKEIVGAKANDDFTITLTFDNGEIRLYDASPLLKKGTVFEPFADINNFKRLYIDDEHCICWDIDPTVDSNKVWSNKVDLCSDICYLNSVPV